MRNLIVSNIIIKKNSRRLQSIWVILLLVSFFLSGCFEKDTPVPAYQWDGPSFQMTKSIYDYQVFYQLEGNKEVTSCPNDAWDLAFESSKDGFHIRINSGNYLGIAGTGTDKFTSEFQNGILEYKFDNPNGNPDSTAVGNWWDPDLQQATGQVYLLGQYDGIKYKPLKKIQFLSVSDTNYILRYANPDGTGENIFSVTKEYAFNNSYFSFKNGGEQVAIEPPRDTWDLFFGQYYTILIAPDGTPTPYPVRGTLLNPYKVKAAMDTTMDFVNISKADLPAFDFTTKGDIIGHNWKDVDVNESSNTATYTVRDGYNYIIKSVNGDYYKLQFTSYTNDKAERGYPSFDILNLSAADSI